MITRKAVLILLCITVLSPILLFTTTTSNDGFVDDLPNWVSSDDVKEPIKVEKSDELSDLDKISSQLSEKLVKGLRWKKPRESTSRVLSAASEGTQLDEEPRIKQVTKRENNDANGAQNSQTNFKENRGNKDEKQSERTPPKAEARKVRVHNHRTSTSIVRQLKDQLIRARVYQSLGPLRIHPEFIREIRARARDVQKVLGDAIKDSELPKSATEKLKLMEQTLAKGKQMHDDCSAVVKKLRAMLHTSEEQLQVHKKQTFFLAQLAAKTIPKGLHCLPLRLSIEYYSLDSTKQQFPHQEKLENPALYHYALFSDNILAASVVVNSTVTNAKNPGSHVFHIVTDRLNYAAMRMWFLANPPGQATIQVQNIEDFTWLNETYSPVLKQLSSQSMIDYYFRTHHANSDRNLKYRNPKYLSILNHLRFYLPEIFPKLKKVVFLDDDIVVQKDLTRLWEVNLKGNVNGAVETCGGSFHRFDRYLNFSHPLIAKNFDPHACGWAYGMNAFDLEEWKKQKITEVYHSWQNLNHDRLLWKLGTLPPGLITFWKRTYPLERSWHVLGLGYNSNVNIKDIDGAAVIHYNGNLKPWLEIGMPKYRDYWSKYVDYDQLYLRECNLSP